VEKEDNLLTTWKEISSYLKCDVRTCKRWENTYGLPVYRISDSVNTRVFSYKDEIDNWLVRKKNNKRNLEKLFLFRFTREKALFLVFLIILGVLALFFVLKNSDNDIPWEFKVQNSSLILLNKNGNELWKHNTGIENLCGYEHYKKHFQYRRRINNIESSLPHIIIKDITNDKKPEVLFSIQTQDEFDEGIIYCFSYKGDELWTLDTGMELKFGKKEISKDYRIHGFDVYDLDKDGSLEIIIFATHRHDFPTQLLILNSKGEKLGEYWNSGRFSDLQFIDLNNDGRDEIILSGCNNEYRKGCLIVFDTAQIRGGSPQSIEEFICKELESGTEKYYILFPRTDLDLLEAKVEAISTIDDLENHRLLLTSLVGRILFELSYDLEIQSITFSHMFQQKHKLAHLEGRINSELNEEYEENLKKGILYYDGEDWAPTPTMTSYWKSKSTNN